MTVRSDDVFDSYGLHILRSLRGIIRAADMHSRRLNDEFKITTPQMICLHSLERQSEMTLSGLAADVNLSVSTVNGIVDRLEDKGLATRKRSDLDRRKVSLAITEAGLAVTRAAPPLLQEGFTEALRGLPEMEQATIAQSLERLVGLMEVVPADNGRHDPGTRKVEDTDVS